MESVLRKKKQTVALNSVAASAFLTVVKLLVGISTGSIGIISEGVHSALDFGAATLTYFAVRESDKPADEKHLYGHSKVESVSALIETGLLLLTSAWIIYEALQKIIGKNQEIKVTWYSFVVIILAILIDFSRSRALSKVAKEAKSQALEADALHFSSDIFSSLVVLLGLVFVDLGVAKADAVAALGVSLFVLRAGFSLGRRTIDILIDAAPAGLTQEIFELAEKVDGVIGVEKIRVRLAGATVFIDMIVTVSRKLPLEKTQIITRSIDEKIKKIIPEADITIHTKPLSLDSETISERIQIIAANHNLTVHDIVVHTQNSRRHVSFDLEVDASLTIQKSHVLASLLEKAIREELGNDVEVITHIEPLRSEAIEGNRVSQEETIKIENVIRKIIAKFETIKDAHNIRIRKSQNKYFISVHCTFDGNSQIEEAHNLASQLEYLIKEALPKTQRVVIHPEPIPKQDKGVRRSKF